MKKKRTEVTDDDLYLREDGPAGIVFGNVGSTGFKCVLLDSDLRELDHVEVHHPNHGWVLGVIDKVELRSDLDHEGALMKYLGRDLKVSYERVGTVSLLGYRNERGVLCRPLTPILPSARVYKPSSENLSRVLGLHVGADNGIYLGKIPNSDARVMISATELVQKHFSIIAKSGSGKSYACGVVAEELNKLDIPVVILDLHGEYRSMISPNIDDDDYRRMERFGISPKGLGERMVEFSFRGDDNEAPGLGIDLRGFRAEDLLELMGIKNLGSGTSVLYNALGKVREILGDDWEIYDLSASVQVENHPAKWNILSGLEHLSRMSMFKNPPTPLVDIVVPGKVCVIDLKDVPLDQQQAGTAALLKRLFSARKEGTIPPFMLMIEEAHNFCPQSGPAITSPVLRTIASEGRKFGLGLTIVTQRPAKVDKNVLSQCGTQMILKVTNPNDLKAVMASFEGLNSRMADEIQNLPVAVALIVGGSLSVPVMVEVRTRATRHGGVSVDILTDIKRRRN
ncbi:MAG: ATP-binding protein [Thermoplasmatota archaeon]